MSSASIPVAAGDAAQLASGKGHTDENFPVASLLLKREARAPVMAFYRFARLADDIADHPTATPADKLARLAAMRSGLGGSGSGSGTAEAMALGAVMAERGLDPVHANDLLDAFVHDVTENRYADWDALIGYCRLSAMPVGRFVLDVHGESRETWPASDALCAALQIINHLQDCAKDYRALGRAYIPLDTGIVVTELAEPRASVSLRGIISTLATRTRGLLDASAGLAASIRDRRLAAEVAVIHRLARDLVGLLETRDPLSEPVHHGKLRTLTLALRAALPVLLR